MDGGSTSREIVQRWLFPFCGIGGGALGFSRAKASLERHGLTGRVEVVGGIDIDPGVCRTSATTPRIAGCGYCVTPQAPTRLSGPRGFESSSSRRCPVADRPMLFSAPMVRALLAGKKTVTRRPATWRPKAFTPPQTEPGDHPGAPTWEPSGRHTVVHTHPDGELCGAPVIRCPALVGDRIWVRETTFIAPPSFGDADLTSHTDDEGHRRMVGHVATMDSESIRCARDYGIKQTPAVHMPRWAARIVLDVVSVRVERLHAIDDADAEREGVRFFDPEHLWDPDIVWDPRPFTPREVFGALWCTLNGDESWRANPWVWRLEFKVATAGAATLSDTKEVLRG